MLEVYGWLNWATSGTTRGSRNRSFNAMLLRRDGGNQEVPSWGLVAREDHERFFRAVIPVGWPDQEPSWPAFLEGGAVPRITDTRGQCLAAPGPARRPQPLALPPEEASKKKSLPCLSWGT